MSYHAQFESNLSLSGANADHRFPIDPCYSQKVVAQIYAGLTGVSLKSNLDTELSKSVAEIVKRLKKIR